MKKKVVILYVLFMISSFSIGLFSAKYLRHRYQEKAMENAAVSVLNEPTKERVFIDIYGNPLIYDYSIAVDSSYALVQIQSLGKDGVPNTDDDWYLEKRDYNKSRLFGKYGKEFAKGVLDKILDKQKEEENVDN